MTAANPPNRSRRFLPSRSRLRLPATRGGFAWLAVLLIVGTFLAVQFGRQVYANYQIGQQAEAIQREIAAAEAANEGLRSELHYLESRAYVSAESRRLTNLGAPGERVLIVPPGAEEPLPDALNPAAQPAPPLLEQWLDLFFGVE